MHQDPVRVRIFAHTDGTEARSLSSALSSMRGETVKNRLVELGILTDLIQIVIYGASQPLVPSKLDETEVQNRRVEIVLERLRPYCTEGVSEEVSMQDRHIGDVRVTRIDKQMWPGFPARAFLP